MAGKSNYLENKVLDHVLRVASFTQPSALYVALFASGSGPGEAGGGTELPTAAGYARQAVTFGAAVNGVSLNLADVDFFTPSGAGAAIGTTTVGHFGIYDALSGGNLLYFGDLVAPKTITTGDLLRIPTNGLSVSED